MNVAQDQLRVSVAPHGYSWNRITIIRGDGSTLARAEFVERCYFTYDDLAAKQACEKANSALARVDAMTGGER